MEQGCTEFCDIDLNEGAQREERDNDDKKGAGQCIYLGNRGYTLDQKEINSMSSDEAKKACKEEQLEEAVYDVVCTIGEKYHPEGIQTDRYQMYYSPIKMAGSDGSETGVDLNAGTNGPEIYMYYTTTWGVKQFNDKLGKDSRNNVSPRPAEYFKSPLTSICFTMYDRVPYSKETGAGSIGDNDKPWEFVLYSDYSSPVDLNDGAIKLDNDLHTANNRISMFAQRENGFVKKGAEITGGFLAGTVEVGEMWLNK